MKRIVLFWIPLLLLLLVNCTTESFDFGDQEGILVEGSGGGGSAERNGRSGNLPPPLNPASCAGAAYSATSFFERLRVLIVR